MEIILSCKFNRSVKIVIQLLNIFPYFRKSCPAPHILYSFVYKCSSVSMYCAFTRIIRQHPAWLAVYTPLTARGIEIWLCDFWCTLYIVQFQCNARSLELSDNILHDWLFPHHWQTVLKKSGSVTLLQQHFLFKCLLIAYFCLQTSALPTKDNLLTFLLILHLWADKCIMLMTFISCSYHSRHWICTYSLFSHSWQAVFNSSWNLMV